MARLSAGTSPGFFPEEIARHERLQSGAQPGFHLVVDWRLAAAAARAAGSVEFLLQARALVLYEGRDLCEQARRIQRPSAGASGGRGASS